MPRTRRPWLGPALGALAVVLLVAFPFMLTSPYLINAAILTLFYAYVASAWNISGGFAGMHSFGHAAFFGIGAYTSTILLLSTGLSPWLGMLAGGLVATVVGALMGTVGARVRGIHFVLLTIAFAEVLRVFTMSTNNIGSIVIGAGNGLNIPLLGNSPLAFQFRSKVPYYYTMLVMLLGLLYLVHRLSRSRFGYYLTALREDPDAAAALGIPVQQYKVRAMILSAFVTALAGTFLGQMLLHVESERYLGVDLSVEMVTMSIAGGMGTVLGPVLGAFVLQPLSEFIRATFGGTWMMGGNAIFYGALLIVVITFVPKGLWPMISRLLFGRQSPPLPPAEPGDLSLLSPPGAPLPPGEPLLTVTGVSKSFGGLKAVQQVSLTVSPGEIVGVIGPNGAGKTTFFNLLTGFYRTEGGGIRLAGRDLAGLRPDQFCAAGIGRTFQVVKPFRNLTVRENVVIAALVHHPDMLSAHRVALTVLRFVGLEPKQDYLASELTIADMKRLELARALATRPRLLLLDEVMAGLTPTEAKEILAEIGRIRDLGITIIVVEHVMHVIMSLCHRVVVLKTGIKIADDIPAEIARNPEVIEAYLGEEYRHARTQTG